MKLKLVGPEHIGRGYDALVLFEFEGSPRPEMPGKLAAFRDSGEITGKFLELTLLHEGLEGYEARRVLLAGAGKREKFDISALWKLSAAAARLLKGKGVKSAAIALEAGFDSAAHVSATVQAVIEACWEPDRLKTNADKDGSRSIDELGISASGEASALEAAIAAGQIIGEAANLTRDISVEPPNLLTPMALADRARAMAKANGLTCEVLDQDRMRQLGMGALLGVAQGSAEPPAMIIIEYKPAKSGGSNPSKLALIGKGVTFDTGGISIKPADGMEKMKYDMCGAAAVIGAMQAIARLKPAVAVTGIVPAVENMPGSKAQRPGDIVTSLSGKTIEVLNTDAEGRLILADAITYAKQLGCTHLVDAATLTGAIVVALGNSQSGVFTNNDEFLARWMSAAKASGEKMWHMPAGDEYRELLKTVYADIGNVGGRAGGASSAAVFLKEFVGETPWIHVDIAGTAWLDDAKPYMAKGPTAIPLGTFVRLAQDWQ